MKIKTNALGVITFFLTRSLLLFGIFKILLKQSQTTMVFSIFLGGILGFFLIFFFDLLFKKLKNDDLFSMMKQIFPPWFFSIIRFFTICFFLYLFLNLTSKTVDFINYHYLSGYTPFIILFTFLLFLFYLGTKSKETIKKVILVLTIFITIVYLISLLGTISYVDIDNLKPLTITNYSTWIKSSVLIASFCALPNILNLFFYQKQEKYIRKHFFLGYILGVLSILIEIIIILGIFGVHLVELYPYPEIAILKKISFFDIFERMEVMLSLGWLMEASIILMILIHLVLWEITKDKLKSRKKIIYFLLFIINFTLIFKIDTYPYIFLLLLIFGLALPLLVFLQEKFTKKRRATF